MEVAQNKGQKVVEQLTTAVGTDEPLSPVNKIIQQSLNEPITYLQNIVDDKIPLDGAEEEVNKFTFKPLKDLGISIINKKIELQNLPQPAAADGNAELSAIVNAINNIVSTANEQKSRTESLEKLLEKLKANPNQTAAAQIFLIQECVLQMNDLIVNGGAGSNDALVHRLYKKTQDAVRDLDFYNEPEYSDEGDDDNRVADAERTIDAMRELLISQNKELKQLKADFEETLETKKALEEALQDGEQLIEKSASRTIIKGVNNYIKKNGRLEDRFRSWFSVFALMNTYIVESSGKTYNHFLILYVIIIFLSGYIYYTHKKQ